jgi:hypothetical protein
MNKLFRIPEIPQIEKPPMGKFGEDAVKELQKTIIEYNQATTRQTNQLIILTWVIAILTFFMFIGLSIQIYIALRG